MGGGGRPRSSNAQRSTVVVDGATYEYAAHMAGVNFFVVVPFKAASFQGASGTDL